MFKLGFKQGASPNIVCIGAHCDDIEIGCGGAIAALAQAIPGAHFHCWVFSGQGVRAQESAACLNRLLGAGRSSLQVFDHRDGFFPAEWTQIKEHKRTREDHQPVDEPVDEHHFFPAETFLVEASDEGHALRVAGLEIVPSTQRGQVSAHNHGHRIAPEPRQLEFQFEIDEFERQITQTHSQRWDIA